MCIIGAGVVYRMGSALRAHFVDKSPIYWNSNKKAGSDEDYHGNFDATQFERWFFNLCQTLSRQFGPCYIFMDGASYHKRNLTPCPTTRTRKADIQVWLYNHGKKMH
ncbi:hypothetical protein PHMEG_00031457 [Phytophthora megakarya]|uniref:DDE-1 domain-containing protein n=1 Tax=Phytophthora megakarya TaxID=4795 RepID=A0A225UY48_9STRA|nr:hypothetical protein PHMEG_00031457 [Phytophthora megakarya]